jgi:hypothetical protein
VLWLVFQSHFLKIFPTLSDGKRTYSKINNPIPVFSAILHPLKYLKSLH